MNFSFKNIFLKGLGVLLPTVLTIWILVTAYQFVDQYIAGPINAGVKELILASPFGPQVDLEEDKALIAEAKLEADPKDKAKLEVRKTELTAHFTTTQISEAQNSFYRRAKKALEMDDNEELKYEDLTPEQQSQLDELVLDTRQSAPSDPELLKILQKAEQDFNINTAKKIALNKLWNKAKIGAWPVLDLIGLLVAVILIYLAGLIVGSYIGRSFIARGEALLKRIPLFKQVYPYVKQVTDFFIADNKNQFEFNRVVAVQYPRKGIWSLALLTGGTMKSIAEAAGEECVTVFIPSSPTPFTGYVITVPLQDTVELPITIDDALRFTVSGGVIVPPSQVIEEALGNDNKLAELGNEMKSPQPDTSTPAQNA